MSTSGGTVEGRILVVAPDPTIRHGVRRALHDFGAVVDTASTERQALTRVLHHQYAIVLCQVCVPASHAFELIKQVKELGSAAVFILMNTAGPLSCELDEHDDTIVGLLPQPLDARELVSLVQRASAIAQRRRPSSIAPTRSGAACGPILVLDDDPVDAEAVRVCLRNIGYEESLLNQARRAREALELVSQRQFSFAVVALNLADAPGLDIVRQLYASDPNLAILVTASRHGALTQQALACGAQEIVAKEALHTELESAIERALLRKAADRDVRYRATHDPMTGLFNRTRFMDALERALARIRRRTSACAVIYIDLDEFKPVNDRFGHAAGDIVLKEVAARLKHALRECDSAARLGGDEFAVLVEDVGDAASIRPLAQRILRQLARPFSTLEGTEVHVAASLGIALCSPSVGCTALSVMDAADAAMFNAKDAGGNQYCFATDRVPSANESQDQISVEIAQSAAESDYYLMFQPQVDLSTHSIVGLEALLRWRRGRSKGIGPDQFIPILEQTGLIVDVGAWVLREACRSMAAWASRHERKVRVAVNVSPLQLERENFASYVEQVVKEAGLRPEQLELEITELTLMRDTGSIQRTLTALRAMGVRLVLDDFGTGYASLSYLRRYPVDGLKIDRSFTAALLTEHASRVLVGSIIDLAHQLDMEVVAEGVEQLPQVRYLRDRGCDTCQGFLFGRPHFLGDTRNSGFWRAGQGPVSGPPVEASESDVVELGVEPTALEG